MRTVTAGTIVLGIAVALAGCGAVGGHGSRPAAGGNGATRGAAGQAYSSQSPHQRCVSEVDSLIAETISAVEDGYPLGLNPNSVMDRYGAESAAFQAFSAVNGQVISYIAEHGTSGAFQSAAGQVPGLCAEYGA